MLYEPARSSCLEYPSQQMHKDSTHSASTQTATSSVVAQKPWARASQHLGPRAQQSPWSATAEHSCLQPTAAPACAVTVSLAGAGVPHALLLLQGPLAAAHVTPRSNVSAQSEQCISTNWVVVPAGCSGAAPLQVSSLAGSCSAERQTYIHMWHKTEHKPHRASNKPYVHVQQHTHHALRRGAKNTLPAKAQS
jgi:hypothetical protein